LCTAFRSETASAYRQSHIDDNVDNKLDTKALFGVPATWWCAAYFLADVGVETGISGWVVSFMLRTRHATPYLAGLSLSGFWAGMAVGRLVLGPLTDKMGVRKSTILYLTFTVLNMVAFAIIPYPAISVVLMMFVGFLMGPLFPSGVIVLTQLLPKEIHVAAVSALSFKVWGLGSSVTPF
jgi:fucose permease